MAGGGCMAIVATKYGMLLPPTTFSSSVTGAVLATAAIASL